MACFFDKCVHLNLCVLGRAMVAEVWFLKDMEKLRMSVLVAWYVAQGSSCGCAKPPEANVACTLRQS